MSEALVDEIEAINSIYGDNTLIQDQDPSVFILTLPGDTASLRLQFPQTYPDVPPTVLGTHSAGSGGKRGAAARDLSLFRDAVSEVYEPGQVCLFDALEKVQELLAAAKEGGGDEEGEKEGGEEEKVKEEDRGTPSPSTGAVPPSDSSFSHQSGLGPPPPWTLSIPFVENKSTFVARCTPVTSPSQAADFLAHLLASDKRVRTATHNITAWRIRGPNGTSFQDCDDDGETAAGGRLLHLMQLMDLWDTMVVVTRWYGGQKLGPRRFALINQTARDAFMRAGLVKEDAVAGGAGGKKKGGK
ncbi:ribosomal protein S5 domain 2-type protein [Corynascus novoguineensis]|uniref:Ribosomal protein S5 domain 2-type protein n=1 Tax=Corynascus novoguineensis TaxID=1126955 RepID=A0AAN7D1W1_9PEZI|nr:ribosomal protein S5 domain 2-type protein [Corynascus novoguineensis]